MHNTTKNMFSDVMEVVKGNLFKRQSKIEQILQRILFFNFE